MKVPKPPSLWRAVGWMLGAALVVRVSTMDLPPGTRSNVVLCTVMVLFFTYVTALIISDRGDP